MRYSSDFVTLQTCSLRSVVVLARYNFHTLF
nr:MAG TPA: hypothetical protein [Caudoviricetes sp.]